MLPDDKLYAQRYWGQNTAKEELIREEKFPFVDIQTAMTHCILESYFSGNQVDSILDAGAGTGRYSIPLAAKGYGVTHLDISIDMIEEASRQAQKAGLVKLNFVEGSVVDLAEFKDQNFDLTLSFDAPISYSYPYHEKAIQELCRVTSKTLMLMVTNRSGTVPFMVDFDLSGDYLPPKFDQKIDSFFASKNFLKNGIEKWPNEVQEFLDLSGNSIPSDYGFRPKEISQLLEQEGFEILSMGGPCALARSIKSKSLEKIRTERHLFDPFIQLSLEFDFNPNNLGLGAVNLFVVAQRKAT